MIHPALHWTKIDGQVGAIIKLITLLGGNKNIQAAKDMDVIKAWGLSCPHLHGRACLWICQVQE